MFNTVRTGMATGLGFQRDSGNWYVRVLHTDGSSGHNTGFKKRNFACEVLHGSDQGPFSSKLVLVLVVVPLQVSHENLHENIKLESVVVYGDF